MVQWPAVLAVLSVYITGVTIPGPNFVAVVHKAVSYTRAAALALVAGIVIVNLFWATCAILGVGIVFAAFPWAALAVKVAGAAYLIWFGGNLILKAGSGSAQSNTATAAVNVQEAAGLRQAFVQGFLTNIVNPKSMAFFAAVFASATPAHVSWPTFAAMLGVVGVVATSWYSMVAILMSHARIASHYRAGKLWIDRLCGGIIVALGIRQLAR